MPTATATVSSSPWSQWSQWLIYVQAIWWRACMSLGMFLHRLARPRPMSPAFRVGIQVTLSSTAGATAGAGGRDERIELVFYAPAGYRCPIFISNMGGLRIGGDGSCPKTRYPVVINFHGGGFTLGAPTDDARWASAVVDKVGAVVVSVGYRLAPEWPFPAAVEDGVDAVLWLYRHADALGLDRKRFALSGFSAGGNLCFTVSLRLRDELRRRAEMGVERGFVDCDDEEGDGRGRGAWGQDGDDGRDGEDQDNVRLLALVAWYPGVDYTRPREERRRSNPGGAHKSLSPIFTNLFDAAYLPWPARSIKSRSGAVSKQVYSNPYLSPAVAPDEDLIEGLPDHIVMYTCGWDGLLVEAEEFRERLWDLPARWRGRVDGNREMKKRKKKEVRGRIIPRVVHAWDKSPAAVFWDPGKKKMASVMAWYDEACRELRRVFELDEPRYSVDSGTRL